ncbi:hypothetical protein Vi05172_g10628 [Venturia inaequalis]|nr:hypothetical protein Vi05172_g10628 [Venturia inaequalis]
MFFASITPFSTLSFAPLIPLLSGITVNTPIKVQYSRTKPVAFSINAR